MSIADTIRDTIRDSWADYVLDNLPNPIDWIEGLDYIGDKLYPVQRFVIKLSYGIPLDDQTKIIELKNDTNEITQYVMTEVEYLHYLYEEGRCNWKDQEREPCEIWLGIGRRGGKSLLLGHLSAYSTMRLLSLRNPQQYYGISEKMEIGTVVVSTSRSQALELLKVSTGDIESLPFIGSMADPKILGTILKFRLPEDDTEGERLESEEDPFRPFRLNLTSFGADSATSRGYSIIFLVFDEYAFFMNEKQKHTSWSIYDALVPSTSTFGSDYKIFFASSLGKKIGKFYDLNGQMMEDKMGLVLRIPSWHANPGLSPRSLRTFKKSPSFSREYGSDWSQGDVKWLDSVMVDNCLYDEVNTTVRGRYFFMGSDLGLVEDGTSHSVVYPYEGKVYVPDNVFYQAHDEEFKDKNCLDINVMGVRGTDFFKKYRCLLGVYDQWNSFGYDAFIDTSLKDRYLSLGFNETLNHTAYFLLLNLLENDRLRISRVLLKLIYDLKQLEDSSLKKGILKIEGPKGRGDDTTDSLARAVLAMYRFLAENPSYRKVFGLEIPDAINATALERSYALGAISRPQPMVGGVSQTAIMKHTLKTGQGMIDNRRAFLRRLRGR